MQKLSLTLALVLVLFLGCSTRAIHRPTTNVTSPKYIEEINNEIWHDIEKWPKTIRHDDSFYNINYYGYSPEEQINLFTSDLNDIDRNYPYGASYLRETECNKKHFQECLYGPLFKWLPNGSIIIKSMIDDQLNLEDYSFYTNGELAIAEAYNRIEDIYTESIFDLNGNELGFLIIKNQGKWYKLRNEKYFWHGKPISKKEYRLYKNKFIKLHGKQLKKKL